MSAFGYLHPEEGEVENHTFHDPTLPSAAFAQGQEPQDSQAPQSWEFTSAYLQDISHPPFAPDYHFQPDYPAEPSPPQRSFLDNILNPTEFSSFGYSFGGDSMPSSRAQEGPSRPSNGLVDLTDDSPEVTGTTAPRKTKRGSPTPGPSNKRAKRSDGSATKTEGNSIQATVEEIDLSDDRQTVQDVLQKQREEAVKAQTPPEEGEKPITFNNFNCVICMDTPTDLTATACGHLFCHTCLMEALIAGENRGGPGEPRRSQCPVCRKNIKRDKNSDIIPLLLKKGLATQPRKTKSTPTGSDTATASKKPALPRLRPLKKTRLRSPSPPLGRNTTRAPQQPSQRRNPPRVPPPTLRRSMTTRPNHWIDGSPTRPARRQAEIRANTRREQAEIRANTRREQAEIRANARREQAEIRTNAKRERWLASREYPEEI